MKINLKPKKMESTSANSTLMVFVNVALHINLFIKRRTAKITLKAASVRAMFVLTVTDRTVGSSRVPKVAIRQPAVFSCPEQL